MSLMNKLLEDTIKQRNFRKALIPLLGFWPFNLSYYRLALTHKSAFNSLPNAPKISNERLEFLGDAILGALVAELVFKKFPTEDEGFLSEMRAKMVNRSHLNHLAEKMGLTKLILYDPKLFRGSSPSGSIPGDALEALIGAIYLDRGYKTALRFYKNKIFDVFLDLEELSQSQINYKSKLLEWGQRQGKEVIFESQENLPGIKDKLFRIRVLIEGQEYGIGEGQNKKNAEKMGAEIACQNLKI